MGSDSDWEGAARMLDLKVPKRSLFSEDPKKLIGQIGPFDISVRYAEGGEGHPDRTKFTVGFPPGPWDEHRITVKPGALVGQKLRRPRYVETGDGVFDEALPRSTETTETQCGHRRLGQPPSHHPPQECVARPPGPCRGRSPGDGTPTPIRSSLRTRPLDWGQREGSIGRQSVRAMVACAEVLISGH